MKKLLVILLLTSGFSAMAQIEKGATMVGGSLSLQTTKNNSSFAINPNVGVFILDNFAAGGFLNLNFSKQGNVKGSQVGLGPFARYYFGKAQTKPFVVAEGSYLFQKVKSTDPTVNTISNNGVGYLLGLGFAAFVNDVVAVEGLGGFNNSKFKNTNGAGGFALRLGFQLYFNRGSYTTLKSNVLGGSN